MNYCKTLVLASALILSVFSGSALAQRRAIPAPRFEAPGGNPDTRPEKPIRRDGDENRPVQPRVAPRREPTPQPRQEIDPEQEIRRIERDSQFRNPSGGAEVNQQTPNGNRIDRDPDGTIHIR